MPRLVRKQENLPAPGLHFLPTHYLFPFPISAFRQKIWTDSPNNSQWSDLRKERHEIHRLQGRHQPCPLPGRHQWAAGPFDPADRSVAVDRHHKDVRPFLDPLEIGEVPDVKEIETAVGEGDPLALFLETAEDRNELTERKNFTAQNELQLTRTGCVRS